MDFKLTRERDLGARAEDVAQEAVDATVTTYANDAGIDVEEHLRRQFASRGLQPLEEDEVTTLAEHIRSGRSVGLGEHDGSVEGPA